ncbi:MAG: enoyl-CoA hydratase/isomerase family protein [Candidatus Dormibacteria bacterium]
MAEAGGPVARLILNRPEQRNAISAAMWRLMAERLGLLAARPELRVLVVSGAGERSFTAGADLGELAGRASLAGQDDYATSMAAGLEALRTFPRPTVAAIQGPALGAGYHLALACDFRIAADDVVVGVPAARYGLMFGPSHFQRMVSVLGLQTTRLVMFLGRSYRAPEALRLGLVDEVVPRTELTGRVEALAGELAANAPLTLSASKAVLVALEDSPGGLDAPTRARLDLLVQQVYGSRDLAEGLRSFFEGRPPGFSGS